MWNGLNWQLSVMKNCPRWTFDHGRSPPTAAQYPKGTTTSSMTHTVTPDWERYKREILLRVPLTIQTDTCVCRAGLFKHRWPVPPLSASLLVTGDFPAKHFSQPLAYYTQQLICNPIKQGVAIPSGEQMAQESNSQGHINIFKNASE